MQDKPDYQFRARVVAGETQNTDTSIYEVIEDDKEDKAATSSATSSLYAYFGYSSIRRPDEGNGLVMFLNNTKDEDIALVVRTREGKQISYWLGAKSSCGDKLEYDSRLKSVVAYGYL
ncbi:hypothetical protein CBS101457_005861 [Exobasidium rhododendri]|nr:hypothetical protein CBS101457_005861 [Exobasidium rhododendri]